MDFDLTEEQRDFQKAVREFAQEVVAPVAEEHDREELVRSPKLLAETQWQQAIRAPDLVPS